MKKLILTKYVRGVGSIGQLINVADGFARNYLIPNGLAILATSSNIKMFEERKEELKAKNIEAKNKAEAVASVIESTTLVFIKQAAEDGRLFGSVSKKEICSKLIEALGEHHRELHDPITDSHIILENPIKYLGTYSISVVLHAEVAVSITIITARTSTEASVAVASHSALRSKNAQAETTGEDVNKILT